MLNYVQTAISETIVPLFASDEARAGSHQQHQRTSESNLEASDHFVAEGAVSFRKAQIETDDLAEFISGIECGQVAFVEDTRPMTSRILADLFTGALQADDDPEAYNIGFIVGFIDALCRARKSYPHGYWRRLLALQMQHEGERA